MIENPYLKRENNKPIGDHGRKAEKRMAKRVGGVEQPLSGVLPDAKGDVQLIAPHKEALIENKATTLTAMKLEKKWLYKIYTEAQVKGMIPALAFQFTDLRGRSEKMERWVAIPEADFVELMHKAGE